LLCYCYLFVVEPDPENQASEKQNGNQLEEQEAQHQNEIIVKEFRKGNDEIGNDREDKATGNQEEVYRQQRTKTGAATETAAEEQTKDESWFISTHPPL